MKSPMQKQIGRMEDLKSVVLLSLQKKIVMDKDEIFWFSLDTWYATEWPQDTGN